MPIGGRAGFAGAAVPITVTGNDLLNLWDRESRGPKVLLQLRSAARASMPGLRGGERPRRPLLRRVRCAARAGAAPPDRRGRTATGLGPLRRPGRLHAALRGPGSGSSTGAPVALLRDRSPRDR